jgi:hypothetical protein
MESATKPPRRSSTSPAKRDAVLAQYRASELTQRAFCDQIGLPLSTLQWWLVRARRAETSQRPAITFAEVPTPVMAPTSTWAIEITTPDGWIVRFRDPHAATDLRAWLSREGC